MKNVWVVSEGSPGHVSQSLGFVKALEKQCPVHLCEVFGRTSVRGWQRHLIRYCMGRTGRPIPEKLLSKIVKLDIPKDSEKPDLIVSSGGKSVFAAHFFASKYQAPYVFIGERKPYPSQWFHTVLSPVEREVNGNTFLLDLIPTPVSSDLISQKGEAEKDTWCMIVGGASRSYPLGDQDWVALAQGMNAVAEHENIRWLLSTSRRTGAEAESILKKNLNSVVLKDAIWWAEKPRKELYSFMARSEMLFVTQDSVTMVTEAVSSGRPVVAIDFPCARFSKTNYLPGYFRRLIQNKYIKSVSVCDFTSGVGFKKVTASCPEKQLDHLVQAILAELQ